MAPTYGSVLPPTGGFRDELKDVDEQVLGPTEDRNVHVASPETK